MKYCPLLLFVSAISSCASMNTPNESLIDSIPVFKVSDAGDVPEEHVVLIPANTDIPVTFSLNGSLFNSNSSSKIMTSLKQDLYLYKYWASLDGRTWVHSHKLLDVKPSGGFDKSGGKVEVNLDLQE